MAGRRVSAMPRGCPEQLSNAPAARVPSKASCVAIAMPLWRHPWPLPAVTDRAAAARRSVRAMIAAFEDFAGLPRWVVWRNEIRNGRATKVPYSPHSGHAKADDPRTWGARSEAEARARQLVNGQGGGIGIEFGDLGDGTALGGIDLDTCRDEDGTFEHMGARDYRALRQLHRDFAQRHRREDFLPLPNRRFAGDPRRSWADAQHGREFKRGNGKDHPPAIELHLSNRYFTVTEQKLDGVPDVIGTVPTELLLWVLTEAGPDFTGAGKRQQTATEQPRHFPIGECLSHRDRVGTSRHDLRRDGRGAAHRS